MRNNKHNTLLIRYTLVNKKKITGKPRTELNLKNACFVHLHIWDNTSIRTHQHNMQLSGCSISCSRCWENNFKTHKKNWPKDVILGLLLARFLKHLCAVCMCVCWYVDMYITITFSLKEVALMRHQVPYIRVCSPDSVGFRYS